MDTPRQPSNAVKYFTISSTITPSIVNYNTNSTTMNFSTLPTRLNKLLPSHHPKRYLDVNLAKRTFRHLKKKINRPTTLYAFTTSSIANPKTPRAFPATAEKEAIVYLPANAHSSALSPSRAVAAKTLVPV
jgi:hypothetical protein